MQKTFAQTGTTYMAIDFIKGQQIRFQFETPDDLINGKRLDAEGALHVNSTDAWKLYVSTQGIENFGSNQVNNQTPMPVGLLELKRTQSTAWIKLSTQNQLIAIGKKTKKRSKDDMDVESDTDCFDNSENRFVRCKTIYLDYMMIPGFMYQPGNYSLDIIYTLTLE